MNYSYKITTNGRKVLAACIDTGAALELTRVAVGKGRISEDADLADQHELIQYVTDGSIGDRRHSQDRLYFSFQYSNVNHPDIDTFYLSEFIVYTRNPDTGKEVDLLYATLGDYTQPVPAYRQDYPPVSYVFPLTLVLSDEVNAYIGAPAGLVTYDELVELQSVSDLTIPATGWKRESGDAGEYPYYLDIDIERVTARMTPNITILPESISVATRCGFAPYARAEKGTVRVYSLFVPEKAISASLLLLSNPPYVRSDGTTGGGDAIQAGTGLSLKNGVMNVNIGNGIAVDRNNHLSVNQTTVITDTDMLDEDSTEQDLKNILLKEDSAEI